MKIAMIFPNPSSEKGISKYSLDLLGSLKKRGVDMGGIDFIQGKPLEIFNIFKEAKEYDTLHIQHEYNLLGGFGLPYFFLLGGLEFLKKKKIVVTMHTVLSQKEKFKSGKFKTFFRKLLYRVQNKWINFTSDKIIVHSEAFKRILINEYNLPKGKIEAFPHAIQEDIKTVSKEKAKRELNLKGNVYLLIGTMVPDHGHDVITKQAREIGKTILIVTNPNSVNDRNANKIKDFLNLNRRIMKENNFEGYVRFDLEEISYVNWWKYFSAADLVLLPYRGGIGSGIFADAMAMKKPVIASNILYFREFAKNYGCLKIAKNDSDFPRIIRESMKPKNYKKMIKECERYFSENGLTSISNRYKFLYESLK